MIKQMQLFCLVLIIEMSIMKCKVIQLEKESLQRQMPLRQAKHSLQSINKSEYIEWTSKIIRQEIFNIGNLQYIGQLYVGTEDVPYRFLLDTGSDVQWLPGIECAQPPNHCHTQRLYDYKKSTTATYNVNQQQEIKYGKGSCKGISGSENVKLLYNSQTFNIPILFTYNDTDMDGLQAHGLIGLSNSKKSKNYLEHAQAAGVIESSLFAFELNINPESSFFYFDDVPEDKLVDMMYFGSIDNDRWVVEIIGTYVDDVDYTTQSYPSAMIDTGTSFIHISQSLFDILLKQHASKVCSFQYREVVCQCDPKVLNANLPTLQFYLKGAILKIYPEDYVYRLGQNCYLSIEPIKNFPFLIFGDVFLRKYFTIFDKSNGRIGFQAIEDTVENVQIVLMYILLPIFSVFSLLGLIYLYFKTASAKQNQVQNPLQQQLLQTNYQSGYFQGRSVSIGSSNAIN